MAEGTNIKNVLMVAAGVVVIALIIYNIYSGLKIQEIGIPGIFSIKFTQKSPSENETPSAYGLTFKKIVWKHHYLMNYDFRGEIEYDVKNTSNDSIVILPPYQAAWFGWGLKQPKAKTVVYGDERSAYSVILKHFSEMKEVRTDFDGKQRQVTSYLWQFNISPSLNPKQTLHYGIVIETEGTEREAFDKEGSFAGMWSPYPVANMMCELSAPKGYKFKKETQFVRDRAGNMKEFAGVNKPEFADDDGKITWNVENPTPNLEYLIKVVIVKAN